VQYQLFSAGARSASQALEQQVVVNQLAIAGLADVGTATSSVTALIGAYGEAAVDTARAGDIFITSVRRGRTTVQEFGPALSSIAPTAEALGIQAEDLAAVLTTLTLRGQETARAATGLQAAIFSVGAPTQEARKFADELGVSLGAGVIEGRNFGDVLVEIVDAVDGDAESLRRLLGEQNAVNAALAIARDRGREYRDVLDDIDNSQGNLARSTERVTETVGFQVQSRFRELGNIFLQLGSELLPVVVDVLDILTPIIRDLAGLFRILVAVIRPVIGVIADLFRWLPDIIPVWNDNVTLQERYAEATELTAGAIDAERSASQRMRGDRVDNQNLTAQQIELNLREAESIRARLLARIAENETIIRSDPQVRDLITSAARARAAAGVIDDPSIDPTTRAGLVPFANAAQGLTARANSLQRELRDALGSSDAINQVEMLTDLIGELRSRLEDPLVGQTEGGASGAAGSSGTLFERIIRQAQQAVVALQDQQERLQDVARRGFSSFGDFFADFVSGADRASRAIDRLRENLANAFLSAAGQIILGGLFPNAGGFFNFLFNPTADALIRFQRGGVLPGPTALALPGGRVGVAGERGREAIVPLVEDSQGNLGVRSVGGGRGGSVIINQDIYARGADSEAVRRLQLLRERDQANLTNQVEQAFIRLQELNRIN